MAELMKQMGHENFHAVGEDWGAVTAIGSPSAVAVPGDAAPKLWAFRKG